MLEGHGRSETIYMELREIREADTGGKRPVI